LGSVGFCHSGIEHCGLTAVPLILIDRVSLHGPQIFRTTTAATLIAYNGTLTLRLPPGLAGRKSQPTVTPSVSYPIGADVHTAVPFSCHAPETFWKYRRQTSSPDWTVRLIEICRTL
jgi:hypothetical protein